jgi:hypothetical protein
VGGSFESDEVTRPRRELRLLGVVQRILLVLALEFGLEGWREAIDHLAAWLAGTQDWLPVGPIAALIVHVMALCVAGSALATLARVVSQRPRLPRGATVARVDARGLHAGDRLAIARQDVATVEVSTDPDLGFALVVTTRSGATLRVPQRSESSARALATALDAPGVYGQPEPGEYGQPASLVFEGVSHPRPRETRTAGLAFLRFVLLSVLSMGLGYVLDRPAAWKWLHFKGWEAEIKYTLAWWLGMLDNPALLHVAAAVAFAATVGPIARRVRAGRVRVGPGGVTTGERTLAAADIASVKAGDASDVTLALRDGREVRLAFGPDRPVVERDLFVERVRAILTEVPEPMYPAAETSGVRVALPAAHAPPEEEDLESEAHASRARRR